ncbi:hypothetical protein ADK53_04070 [Streptomyces sp. WM6373]|uniref:DUF6325 family protein n=1 Tax=Streptomyces TaxID=1883 RepID=UPI0006AE7519|nr:MULTISPECIES: DUF6325 family protein [unclassified Streptomyces]KOU43987.1 hypothetical protein ADK53_04070 [Streptomyces sp. WM6373]KOU75049.1 hypothetical protein ADK96_03650 [Streptomyces sp. IGB124]KOU88639.1 hypothetical protein ADK61_02700 [Streptomyces sp. XY66]KOV46125.1 hypothetical protein ADK97_03950 [Streptomyces sp. H021]
MGPVEFIVLAFPEEQLRVPAVEAVMGLRKTGVVRLIDGLVATRTASGEVLAAEFDEFVELHGLLTGRDAARLIGPEDVQEAADLLERGSCALLLVVEHVWAEDAAVAVRAAGGRIVGSVRIPPDRVPADPRAGVA